MEQWSKSVRIPLEAGTRAYSLADFIMNRNGAAHLESRSCRSRSDWSRAPRNMQRGLTDTKGRLVWILAVRLAPESDCLWVWRQGLNPSGSVCERYQKAKTLKSNPRSKAAARVKELRYLADTDEPCESRFAKVGYHTATAGTVAAGRLRILRCGLQDPRVRYGERKSEPARL